MTRRLPGAWSFSLSIPGESLKLFYSSGQYFKPFSYPTISISYLIIPFSLSIMNVLNLSGRFPEEGGW